MLCEVALHIFFMFLEPLENDLRNHKSQSENTENSLQAPTLRKEIVVKIPKLNLAKYDLPIQIGKKDPSGKTPPTVENDFKNPEFESDEDTVSQNIRKSAISYWDESEKYSKNVDFNLSSS